MPSIPTRAAACSLLALLAVAGCADRQASVSPEARAAAVKVDADAHAALGYRLEWRGFPIMSPGATVTAFGIFGDVVVCQESTSVLTILDARSGAYRCATQLANPLTKFVGVRRDGNRIVSSSETDAYFVSTDSCTLVDRHDLGKVVTTRPVLVNDLLVYGTATGEILGHMASRAINLWGNSVAGDIIADPVSSGSLVAFVSQTGDIAIIDSASSSSVGRAKIRGGVAPNDNFGGPLAMSETTLFVASLDQSLYAFDARTGRQLWRVRTEAPLRSHPVYHDGVLYCELPAQGLTALDPATGDQKWSARSVSGTPIVMRKGRLIVWEPRGGVAAALDPGTGDVMHSVRLKDVSFLQADTFADGNVYAVSPNGVVAKFSPRS